jgi:GntR family transcriptional regulator
MFPVKVNRSDFVTLHEQVAAEIRRAIAEGDIQPGEKLPPAIDIAAVIGVNKNTVIRALHILRLEGILEVAQGRGIRVSGTVEKAAVLDQVRGVLSYARSRGYQRDDVIAMIEGLP